MTSKVLLIAALAVGLTLLHGSGAAPAENRRLTDEELNELDQKLEAVTPEQAAIFVQKLKEHLLKRLHEEREKMRVAADKFEANWVAKLSKESTPEEVAAVEQKMSDFSVAGARESAAKMKLVTEKLKSLREQIEAFLNFGHKTD